MGITVERTPNPAAMKFTVGEPVGGPATFTDGQDSPEFASRILSIDGVNSVFATSDFVTVSADASIDWDAAVPVIVEVLEASFG